MKTPVKKSYRKDTELSIKLLVSVRTSEIGFSGKRTFGIDIFSDEVLRYTTNISAFGEKGPRDSLSRENQTYLR